MREKFKAYWEPLSSNQKRGAVIAAIATALLACSLIAFQTRQKAAAPKNDKQEEKGKVIQIGLDESHLQKSAYLESQKQMDSLKKELDALKTGGPAGDATTDTSARRQTPEEKVEAQLNDFKDNPLLAPSTTKTANSNKGDKEVEALKKQIAEMEAEREAEKKSGERAQQKGSKKGKTKLPKVPDVPLPAPGHAQLPPAPPAGAPPAIPGPTAPPAPVAIPAEKPIEKTIGGIAIASNSARDDRKAKEDADKKKDNRVYLPPSFMPATILSGLDAPVTSGGKGGPVPVLLRIKDLSILPNKVKANLKGCFVIAEGQGNLASERAELRLVNISCLDRKGQSLIDQSLSGFVVDKDGKIGLRGTVVAAKLGANISRMMFAGFLGGIGDALKQTTQTVNTSPLGTTQTLANLDMSKVGQAGIGQGLSSAVGELQKFYLELARQSMPVIEIGATRNVTLVISKGTELEIKDLNGRK